MARMAMWLGVAALALAAGGFPVLLDVDAQGRVRVPRHEGQRPTTSSFWMW